MLLKMVINGKNKLQGRPIYLWKTRMVDIVVRGAKYRGAYWTNENPDGEWTMSISVPTITKYTFLCNSFTCWTWITRWSSFRIGSCCLLYISRHYRVKVVFWLEISKRQHIAFKILITRKIKHRLNYFQFFSPERICTFQ